MSRNASLGLITAPYFYRNVTPPLALHSHGNLTPTGGARVSTAYRQDTNDFATLLIESELANHIRSEMVRDPDTGLWLPGTRLEPARTNQQVRNTEINQAVWNKTRCSVTDTSTRNLPDGNPSSFDVMQEDATAGASHFIWDGNTVITGNPYVISAFAAPINRDWIKFRFDRTTGVNVECFFDVNAGVVGATPAGIIDAGLIWDESGWLRPWMSFMANDTEGKPFYVNIAEDDNDVSFNGLNQDSLYFWGVHFEQGLYPSSLIVTGAGAVTRTVDGDLIFESGLVNGSYQITVLIPICIPPHAPPVDLELLSIYDNAGAATDHLTLWAKQTTGVLKVTSAATAGSAGLSEGVTNIADGKVHWIAASLKPDLLVGWTDGVASGIDYDVGVSDILDRVAHKPMGGWAGGIHVWPRFIPRMPRPVQPVTV